MSLRFEGRPFDGIDAEILRALWAEGRISHAELARRVGLSAPTVADRIKRLEDIGVIQGFGARINPEALGYGLTIVIRAKPLPGEMANMAAVIDETPQIVACDRVSGEDCFIARAHVRDVAEMEAVVDRLLPFGATNSAIVQSKPFDDRLVPL